MVGGWGAAAVYVLAKEEGGALQARWLGHDATSALSQQGKSNRPFLQRTTAS